MGIDMFDSAIGFYLTIIARRVFIFKDRAG